MNNKNTNSIKIIKDKITKMTIDAISIANEIGNLSEVIYDYCAYNPDDLTGNIMTVIEIIKEKSDKLSNLVDTSAIEIFHIKP